MSPNYFKWITSALCAIALVMAIIVFSRFRASSSIVPTERESITVASSTPLDPRHAFVEFVDPARRFIRGDIWSVDLRGPEWGTCMVDLYRPDEQVYAFATTTDAKALMLGPGRFRWQWRSPSDLNLGGWSLRALCGTYENLATADLVFEVTP